jgi:hypothetical protein
MMTEAQRRATLRDGQDAGEMLLDIEARIGQLLPSREEIRDTVKKNLKKGPVASDEGVGKLLPEGLDKGNAYKFRAIAENPEIVEKIKAQAKENEDIPTKTAVRNAINHEKERKEAASLQKSEYSPARHCCHSRQASAPAGLPLLPWCACTRPPQGAPRIDVPVFE